MTLYYYYAIYCRYNNTHINKELLPFGGMRVKMCYDAIVLYSRRSTNSLSPYTGSVPKRISHHDDGTITRRHIII